MKGAAVADASVALTWLLPGEATDVALALRQKAVDRPALALLVPPLFWYEVGNVLWRAIRQGRLSREGAVAALRPGDPAGGSRILPGAGAGTGGFDL